MGSLAANQTGPKRARRRSFLPVWAGSLSRRLSASRASWSFTSLDGHRRTASLGLDPVRRVGRQHSTIAHCNVCPIRYVRHKRWWVRLSPCGGPHLPVYAISLRRLQPKVRIGNASLAESIQIEVSLTGAKLPTRDRRPNIRIFGNIPLFVDNDAVRHSVLVKAKATIVRLGVRHYAHLYGSLHVRIRLEIPWFINLDVPQRCEHAIYEEMLFDADIIRVRRWNHDLLVQQSCIRAHLHLSLLPGITACVPL